MSTSSIPSSVRRPSTRAPADRWFGSQNAFSSWYELKGTNNTPYNLTDDPLIATSGSLFANIDAADSTMGGSGGAECRKDETGYGDGRDYHLSWYLLNPGNPLSGGADGTIYRLHTTGTDPNGAIVSNTDGEQSFALYVSATGGSPRIYGFGAMQMFTPLSASGGATSSEFYLAQIDAVHAGKTVVIQLWDPGDTSPLSANLQILVPDAGGWSPAAMNYRAQTGTSNSNVNTACNTNAQNGVYSIASSTGASLGLFNGCWLTIEIPVPDQLHRGPGRLVEDPLQHERQRHLERRDDVEGDHPRQPGPPQGPLILAPPADPAPGRLGGRALLVAGAPRAADMTTERPFGDGILALVQGDITTIPADAIGNAANAALAGGGGVDGAIHAAGGPSILAELRARYPGGTPTGTAVATGAGDLPARWIVHAVGPVWSGGHRDEPRLLADAYRSALRVASALGARTLTLPAISAGVYGFPLDPAAAIAIRTVADGLRSGADLDRVTFVLYSANTMAAFERALAAAT